MIPASGTWYPVAQRYPGSVATLPVLYQYLVPGPGTGTIIHMHTFYLDYLVSYALLVLKVVFFLFSKYTIDTWYIKKKILPEFFKNLNGPVPLNPGMDLEPVDTTVLCCGKVTSITH
jgi:hypothetical protein